MDPFLSRRTGELVLNHPHTWIAIRIFALFRLFLYFDLFAVLLLVDVVRTLFLNNERSSSQCQTEEDVGAGDTAAAEETLHRDTQTDSQPGNDREEWQAEQTLLDVYQCVAQLINVVSDSCEVILSIDHF